MPDSDVRMPHSDSPGTVFDIITASQIIDDGIVYNLPALPNGEYYTESILNSFGSSQTLEIAVNAAPTPEPTLFGLLAIGSGGLLARRRRRGARRCAWHQSCT